MDTPAATQAGAEPAKEQTPAEVPPVAPKKTSQMSYV